MSTKAAGTAPIIGAAMRAVRVTLGRKLTSRPGCGGADFVVTGPFTVSSVGAHCAAASTVCMPSTQSIVRTLCQLLGACIEYISYTHETMNPLMPAKGGGVRSVYCTMLVRSKCPPHSPTIIIHTYVCSSTHAWLSVQSLRN